MGSVQELSVLIRNSDSLGGLNGYGLIQLVERAQCSEEEASLLLESSSRRGCDVEISLCEMINFCIDQQNHFEEVLVPTSVESDS